MYFLRTKHRKPDTSFLGLWTRPNRFWQKIQHWLIERQVKPQDFSLTLPTCLGLVDSTEDILLHHALLIGRYHIYSSKLKKTLPNLQVFTQTFHKCQEIEKCHAYKTNTVKKYKSKWNLFKWIVTLIYFYLAAPLWLFNLLFNFILFFQNLTPGLAASLVRTLFCFVVCLLFFLFPLSFK